MQSQGLGRKLRHVVLRICVAVALSLLTKSTFAQTPNTANRTVRLNYVYAANLGFGGYTLAGLTANVFTLPLGYTFPVGPDDDWRLRLKLPVQLGLYQFRATDTNGARISIDQQSLAVLPGFELELPVTAQTKVTPFAEIGGARTFGAGSDSNTLIFTTGLRSVTQWHEGPYTLSLGNALIYSGDTSRDYDESYLALENGFEVRRPLGFTVHGIEPDFGVYFADYYYPKSLSFSRFQHDPLKIKNQTEIGFSVGSAKPFDIAFLSNTRAGVSYVFGGGLSVWHVNFGFPF